MTTQTTPKRLAITIPELLAEGVPLRRVDAVYAALQKAVAAAPQLNVYPTLADLARTLRTYPRLR